MGDLHTQRTSINLDIPICFELITVSSPPSIVSITGLVREKKRKEQKSEKHGNIPAPQIPNNINISIRLNPIPDRKVPRESHASA